MFVIRIVIREGRVRRLRSNIRDNYKAGLSGVRDLIKKFPRRYKRNISNSSVGKKKIFPHINLSEKFNVDFF